MHQFPYGIVHPFYRIAENFVFCIQVHDYIVHFSNDFPAVVALMGFGQTGDKGRIGLQDFPGEKFVTLIAGHPHEFRVMHPDHVHGFLGAAFGALGMTGCLIIGIVSAFGAIKNSKFSHNVLS